MVLSENRLDSGFGIKPITLSWLMKNLFHFVYDSLESLGVVHSEVSENLTVDFDTCFVDETHELAVGKIFHTGGSVDTLDPESAEVALFLLAVAVSIGETLLPCVFCYGPHIAAAAIVTTGKFQYFLSFSS